MKTQQLVMTLVHFVLTNIVTLEPVKEHVSVQMAQMIVHHVILSTTHLNATRA
jgi:hypothetical protein